VPFEDMVLDHLVPRAEGGPDVEFNVAVAHAKCNRIRGNARFETTRSRIAREFFKATQPRAYYREAPYREFGR
jgi:5-methylcytosine-specific restriction endonuclease McrA